MNNFPKIFKIYLVILAMLSIAFLIDSHERELAHARVIQSDLEDAQDEARQAAEDAQQAAEDAQQEAEDARQEAEMRSLLNQ